MTYHDTFQLGRDLNFMAVMWSRSHGRLNVLRGRGCCTHLLGLWTRLGWATPFVVRHSWLLKRHSRLRGVICFAKDFVNFILFFDIVCWLFVLAFDCLRLDW